MDTKTCTKCGETKALTEFHRDAKRKDGLALWCKACCKKAADNRKRENREAYLAAKKADYAKHKAKRLAQQVKWKTENPEKYKTKRKNEYWKNRETNLQKQKLHKATPKAKAARAEWLSKNAEKLRERNREKNIRHVQSVTASYAALLLGVSAKDVTPELLEAKRQQLELHRLQRQLQATLKDLTDDHED